MTDEGESYDRVRISQQSHMVLFCTQSAGDLGPFLQRGAVSGISGSHRYGLCAGTPDRRLVRSDCGAGLFHDLRLPVLPGF